MKEALWNLWGFCLFLIHIFGILVGGLGEILREDVCSYGPGSVSDEWDRCVIVGYG